MAPKSLRAIIGKSSLCGHRLSLEWRPMQASASADADLERRRELAADLVRELHDRAPDLLRFADVDLGPAVAQQLFFALRDGTGLTSSRSAAGSAVILVGATLLSAGRRAAQYAAGTGVALVREPIHLETVSAVSEVLAARGAPPLEVVHVGRPLRRRQAGPHLGRFVAPGRALELWPLAARIASRLPPATRGWDAAAGDAAARLRGVAASALLRSATGVAGLEGLAARRPAVAVAFDEKGSWARLIGPALRAHAIPSLDLPHAEASDPVVIRGADYDLMAVYGPRSAAVLRAAGIDGSRIVEIGAPRFDRLLARPPAAPDVPRRAVLAGQYAGGLMTPARLVDVVAGAIAAARAVGATLDVVPHPAQPPGEIEAALTAASRRQAGGSSPGVRREPLHETLRGAWMLVTGWSNSVLEAAICAVPSIVISPGGVAPVRYDLDGLALGASDEAGAARAARSLEDPVVRAGAVARAREALAQHIGPLDGRATERAAELVLRLAAGGAPDAPPGARSA